MNCVKISAVVERSMFVETGCVEISAVVVNSFIVETGSVDNSAVVETSFTVVVKSMVVKITPVDICAGVKIPGATLVVVLCTGHNSTQSPEIYT